MHLLLSHYETFFSVAWTWHQLSWKLSSWFGLDSWNKKGMIVFVFAFIILCLNIQKFSLFTQNLFDSYTTLLFMKIMFMFFDVSLWIRSQRYDLWYEESQGMWGFMLTEKLRYFNLNHCWQHQTSRCKIIW